MNDDFKNKVDGTVDKVKGEAKDTFGQATNDKKKQAEGKVDKAKGAIKDKVQDAKDNLKDS